MGAYYVALTAFLVLAAFFYARSRAVSAVAASGGGVSFHSLPAYHGLYAAMCVLIPLLLIFVVGSILTGKLAVDAGLAHFPADVAADALKRGAALREIENVISGHGSAAGNDALQRAADAYTSMRAIGGWTMLVLGIATAIGGIAHATGRIRPDFRARNNFERFTQVVLAASATIAILTTIGIVFSVLYETGRFFFDPALKGKPTITQFLFGLEWNPQAALRADQGDIATAFGFVPLLTGTLLITLIAIAVAGPLGLFSAIYLSEYATPRFRAWAKPILEILAGVPTVVLGFFAALTVAPLIRGWGEALGLNVASESALAAGLVMGMMIIPFVSSLSDDVINAVPQSLRDGAYALGATKSETIKKVVLPAALPGIVSAFMLAISRAIGETMIVVMAAGLAANLTFNPLDAVTTITVQIKTILVGDQEFDSAKTLAAFALGFVLFFVTLMLNYIALRVVQKYREQYD
ncbi:phosphate ABC transporter permease subunit PstC [Rhabdaerophilum calidifontis]|uniref:phosphate ABC transporter permease subunit PstC n=1 Tax=Rhabdaerophilum calidifontis TaxID=2604328 RepID=UPI001238412D|nr:phosphate ABC transporter permease subunit PstC [Rhabdaerophilum calidifontis]